MEQETTEVLDAQGDTPAQTSRVDRKWLLLSSVIVVLYTASWFLPIGLRKYIGHEGAELAHGLLKDSAKDVLKILTGSKSLDPKLFLKTSGGLYLGLVNELFIVGFLLSLFRNRWCLLFAGPAFLAMTVWGVAFEVYYGYGFTAWWLSGGLLGYLGVKAIYPEKIDAKALAISLPLIVCYLLTVLVLALVLIDS